MSSLLTTCPNGMRVAAMYVDINVLLQYSVPEFTNGTYDQMDDEATIDEEPPNGLPMQDSRTDMQSTITQPFATHMGAGYPGFSGGYGYPPPYPPPLVIVLPPCGATVQIYYGGNGMPHYPHSQPSASQPYAQPLLSHGAASPAHLAATSHNVPLPIPTEIESWFSYLDRHEQRNKDGIVYSPFGPILKAEGFHCMSQLTRKNVQFPDLETWLGIKPGTAVSILQYAAQDLNAVMSGK